MTHSRATGRTRPLALLAMTVLVGLVATGCSNSKATPEELGQQAGQYLLDHPPNGTLDGTTTSQLSTFCGDVAMQDAPKYNEAATGDWAISFADSCVATVVSKANIVQG